ncbi:MAG: hypothetical protein V2B14_00850 [bacterium]
MKTININLIGNLARVPVKTKTEKISGESSEIDTKSKTFSVMIVIISSVIFLICASVWLIASYLTKKANTELTQINSEHTKLKKELAQMTQTQKDFEKERKISELRSFAQDQIKDSLLPWYNILTELAKAIPKDIKIKEISKISSVRKTKKSTILIIRGEVLFKKELGIDPLKTISFFALNINENNDPNPLLSNGIVRNIEYDKVSESYNFTLEANINFLGKSLFFEAPNSSIIEKIMKGEPIKGVLTSEDFKKEDLAL